MAGVSRRLSAISVKHTLQDSDDFMNLDGSGGSDLLHRYRAVSRRVEPEAILPQNLQSDLSAQFIVLHQQQPFIPEKSCLRGSGEHSVVLRLLLSDGSQKRFTQVRHEHRLRAECGHAGVPHLLFNIRPVIGGEYIMMNKSCRHILLLGTAGFIWHCQPNGAALY